MKTNVSTNIIRDSGSKINFIATPNSKSIFEQIFLEKGSKSFNLIGNYGTGKSTFLWACETVLSQKKNLFGLDSFNEINKTYTVLKILGEEESIKRLFALSLGLRGRVNSKRIIETLSERVSAKLSLVIFIDEFGKILENIAKTGDTSDLYFIQQLAEWVNGFDNQVFLITTLHQNFSSYSDSQAITDRQEWEKVKGRFKDLVFNEPVEQLLYFASKELEKISAPQEKLKSLDGILDLVNNSRLVSFNKILSTELIEELFPLDWLSANILVQSLQKYGQNERSLFTFVNESSTVSLTVNKEDFFSVPRVYDYLVQSLSSEINNPNNSHRAQWLTGFRALERAELFFEENYQLASDVIKTILLVNLFSKHGGRLDSDFLRKYFLLTLGVDINHILSKLEKSGIIRFYNHSNKLNFLEGTDLDVEQELINAGKEIGTELNYPSLLKEYTDLDVLYVKRHSFLTGTKRFFEYRVIETLDEIRETREGFDGYINIISFDVVKSDLEQASKNSPENVFVVLGETSTIQENIVKLIKYEIIIQKYIDDKNALKILEQEKRHSLELLSAATSLSLFNSFNYWFINGAKTDIKSSNELHNELSKLCDKIYFKTPVFDNELINRSVLSSPIVTARKSLLRQMLERSNEKDLGYPDDKFPPDKAIYISLLRETGLHIYNEANGTYIFIEPDKKSALSTLWDDCDLFIDSSSSSKKEISGLYDLLDSPPYKLKKGFIDVFVPVYLIIKSEDYGLFYKDNSFIPFLTIDTIDLIQKKPQDFFVKAYNIKGINLNLLETYKELVGISGVRPTQSTFISIYSNFLRFVRSLDQYTLNTSKVSPSAKELRDAVMSSSDPETALFNSIPVALGYGNILDNPEASRLEAFTLEIQAAIKELRGAYSELLNRIEIYLVKAFNLASDKMEEYKAELLLILESIEEDELIPKQKVLYKRLTSALDDRESYLKSIADVVIGYPVEELKDHDESILKDRLNDYAESLILAAKSQSFNKTSGRTKLLQFRFFNADGSVTNEKIVLKELKENQSDIEKIESVLNGFENSKKKEILIQLYSELLKADEHE